MASAGAGLLQDKKDKYVWDHRTLVGDIAIRDTQATLHSATPTPLASGNDTRRLMWRISVRGKPLTHLCQDHAAR